MDKIKIGIQESSPNWRDWKYIKDFQGVAGHFLVSPDASRYIHLEIKAKAYKFIKSKRVKKADIDGSSFLKNAASEIGKSLGVIVATTVAGPLGMWAGYEAWLRSDEIFISFIKFTLVDDTWVYLAIPKTDWENLKEYYSLHW